MTEGRTSIGYLRWMDASIFKRVGMVAVRFFWIWLAILLGDILVWSAYAYTQVEPTRTFTFNFISSNIPFLAGLSIGGGVIVTLILEISDYFKSGQVSEK